MTRLIGVAEVAREAGPRGVTWAEVAKELDLHHGQASGALSRLHRDGALAKLAERRAGSGIYVTPDAVQGREVVERRLRVAKVAETYEEAFAAGQAAGEQAAVARFNGQVAEAGASWLVGYDEGHTAGVAEGRKIAEEEGASEEHLAARFTDGFIAGQNELRSNSVRVIDEMIRSLRLGKPVHIHNKTCWRTDPACALLVARKTVDSGSASRVHYGQ